MGLFFVRLLLFKLHVDLFFHRRSVRSFGSLFLCSSLTHVHAVNFEISMFWIKLGTEQAVRIHATTNYQYMSIRKCSQKRTAKKSHFSVLDSTSRTYCMSMASLVFICLVLFFIFLLCSRSLYLTLLLLDRSMGKVPSAV